MSIVATPASGTYEGSQTVSLSQTFRTGTKSDSRDGKVYKTVSMPDGKWWFAENLAYNVSAENPNGYPANVPVYGYLYSNSQAIANTPPGCHLPTSTEFLAATPGKLSQPYRIVGFGDGTNSYGFSAKGAGLYSIYSGFLHFGTGAFFWCSDYLKFVAMYSVYADPERGQSGGEHKFSARYIVDSGNVEDLLYYSLDGSYPSILYTTPIVVSETATLKTLIAGVVYEFDYTIISVEPTFPILTPCTLQMLCDSKVANSSSGRRRTVSRDSSFVFSATLNLPSQYEQFESTAYNNFPVIGDCEIRQLDLVKYAFRDTEKTSSVKCMIAPGLMNKRTGDFRISCEPNISVDEAMLVAAGSSSLEVLSSSRALSLKCVWTVSFLGASQFIEWLRGSVNRIFTTSVAGIKGVPCQIGDSVSLEIGSTDVKISADLAIVNTKQFPLNITAYRVGNVVTVNTGTVYIGTLVNRLGEIVEVVTTLSNILTFATYPENCYLLIRQGNNVTEWLEL